MCLDDYPPAISFLSKILKSTLRYWTVSIKILKDIKIPFWFDPKRELYQNMQGCVTGA